MGILLTIAYDGTNYYGWQQQPNCISVAARLEEAVSSVFSCSYTLLGASRTDARVHALGQRAHLRLSGGCKIPMQKLPMVLNSHLPDDIRVTAAKGVADDFHPINNALSKTYEYRIQNSSHQNPLLRNYTHFVRKKLDFLAMQQALPYFVGEQDFKSFCAADSSVKTTIRTINWLKLKLEPDDELIILSINGNGFLYNMVRIIAGTLIEMGQGRLCPRSVPQMIAAKDRVAAGQTAPPQGLTLIEIFY